MIYDFSFISWVAFPWSAPNHKLHHIIFWVCLFNSFLKWYIFVMTILRLLGVFNLNEF